MIHPLLMLVNDPSRPQDEASAGVEVCVSLEYGVSVRYSDTHAGLRFHAMSNDNWHSYTNTHYYPPLHKPKTNSSSLQNSKRQWKDKKGSFFDTLWVCHITCKSHTVVGKQEAKEFKRLDTRKVRLATLTNPESYLLNALLLCYDNIMSSKYFHLGIFLDKNCHHDLLIKLITINGILKFGILKIFQRSLLCSPRMPLFDE